MQPIIFPNVTVSMSARDGTPKPYLSVGDGVVGMPPAEAAGVAFALLRAALMAVNGDQPVDNIERKMTLVIRGNHPANVVNATHEELLRAGA